LPADIGQLAGMRQDKQAHFTARHIIHGRPSISLQIMIRIILGMSVPYWLRIEGLCEAATILTKWYAFYVWSCFFVQPFA
jgi:hypothetical protein